MKICFSKVVTIFTSKIMTNFIIGETESPYDELKTNIHIRIGDTIEYISNNQEGYKKFKVILDDDSKELVLHLISNSYHSFSDNEENDIDDDDDCNSYVVLSQESEFHVHENVNNDDVNK